MSSLETTTTTRTDLATQLSKIGLIAIGASLEDFLARATKGRWSSVQMLEEIARLEQADKTRRSLQSRLQRARIGRFKPLADFDWNWPKKIERDLVERAFTLEFIRDGRSLVLLGSNGLGKTMIAKNVAHQAVMAGYSVLFTTAAEIIEDLRSRSPETLRRAVGRYVRPALLVIDEVGYLAYDSHAADLLYRVVDRRYERPGARDTGPRSILLTTNLAFRDWNTVFPNATSVATLLDKLTHYADVTMIEGPSYRVHESQRAAAERRKKRRS
ncbi:MAG TPA: ATP-binding protein [Burkholderiales bacterium]|nr:ATP-binding protein [Burkholderiales bacterium]